LNWLAILVLGKFMLKLEISFRGGWLGEVLRVWNLTDSVFDFWFVTSHYHCQSCLILLWIILIITNILDD
jgi:hypothetical protein